jgi:hypothetical protein
MAGDAITPNHFRALFHRMLEKKPNRFHISAGDDPWGLVVTRTAVSGVQVWYAANTGILTVGITTREMREKLRDGVVPDESWPEHSPSGWLQFRWNVPALDMTRPPQDQDGVDKLRDRVVFAFSWYRDNRIDMQ